MLELTVNHGMAHSILKEVAKSQCEYDANEGGGEMNDLMVRMVSCGSGGMELVIDCGEGLPFSTA